MRFLLLLGLGCKKHLKIKETRNYYFKTIGYCSRTKVKSSLILRRFYATWPLALALGLKCYYLWELYHARVLVITYTCAFYKRCPFNHGACLNLKKKLKLKLKPFKYTSSYTKVIAFVKEYTDDSLCQMLLRDLNNWSKNISMVYSLSSIASETSAYNVMLI